MKVCFIGHRNVNKTEKLYLLLKETIKTLINQGATSFFFGSKSNFDNLSWEIVTELKSIFPFLKRIYVRSAYQNIKKFYSDYLLKFYEESYFPKKIEKAGRYSYVERNYEMIDNSDYCIFYYNENYEPEPKISKKAYFPQKIKSGTKIAYEYAVNKNKNIINLFKQKN